MAKQNIKWLSHLLIIGIFFVLSVIYFYPSIEGKTLQQGDLIHAKGVNHYGQEYAKRTGHKPCWAPQLFSGMPSYQVSGTKKNNFVFITIHRLIKSLGKKDIAILFLYFLGFYVLMLTLNVNRWLAFLGALAYGLSSYNIIIIGAGHITKAYSLGYMPLVVAGFVMIYRKKYWLGALLALLSLGIMINLGHFQIIYYTALFLGLFVIFELIWSVLDKRFKQFLVASAISVGVVILAVLPNTVGLWQTYEMSKYSIRGKSEITSDKKNTGLDKDYALSWSYGIGESFSLMFPNIKGGASGYLMDDPIAMNTVDASYRRFVGQNNHYWGDQPFTSGPVYLGASVIFLAIFGFFFIRDKMKWLLLLATILSIILAWGKNFPALTDFMFYNFPFYNKFRTVSMILVIASFAIPMIAVLGLNEYLQTAKQNNLKFSDKQIKFPFFTALAFTVLIALIFLLIPDIFSFISEQEKQYFHQLAQQNPDVFAQLDPYISALTEARKSIFIHDIFRSLFYFLITAVILLSYIWFKDKETLKNYLIGALALIILFDLFIVDRRYVKISDFQPKRNVDRLFQPTYANKFIMKDKDPDFRVVNITVNPFVDAITSYFHFNIGGYHGAKLRRYQDIIDKYLGSEVMFLQKAFTDTITDVQQAIAQTNILNMLNTKYIIFNPNTIPYLNKFAFGNAWFVRNIKFVNSPKEEIDNLQNVNLRTTAVVDKSKFPSYKFPNLGVNTTLDSSWIKLVYFSPDTLVYEYYSPNESFAVFSEIYYPKGWKAKIDKSPAQIVRANYILRAMTLPAGKHKITMIFAPKACYVAQKIALIGSILVLIAILGLGFMIYKDFRAQPKQNK